MACSGNCDFPIVIDLIDTRTFFDDVTTDYTPFRVYIDPQNDYQGWTHARFEVAVKMSAGDPDEQIQLVDEGGAVHSSITFQAPLSGSDMMIIKSMPISDFTAHYYMPRTIANAAAEGQTWQARVIIEGRNYTKMAVQRQMISGGESTAGAAGTPELNVAFSWAVDLPIVGGNTWEQPPDVNFYTIFKKNASEWNQVTKFQLRATAWVNVSPGVIPSGVGKVGLWNKTTNTLVAAIEFPISSQSIDFPMTMTVDIDDNDPNFAYGDEYEVRILEDITLTPSLFSTFNVSRVDLWGYVSGNAIKAPMAIRMRDWNVGAASTEITAFPQNFCSGTLTMLEASGTGIGTVKLCPLGASLQFHEGITQNVYVGEYRGGVAGHTILNGPLAPNGTAPVTNVAGHGWVLPDGGAIGWYGGYVDQQDNIVNTGTQFFPSHINGIPFSSVARFNYATQNAGPTHARIRLSGFEFDIPVPPGANIVAVKFQMTPGWPTPPISTRNLLSDITIGAAARINGTTSVDHSVDIPGTRANPLSPTNPAYTFQVVELDMTSDRMWDPDDFDTASFEAEIFIENSNNLTTPLLPVFLDGVLPPVRAPRVLVYVDEPCPDVLTFPAGRTWQQEPVSIAPQVYNAPTDTNSGLTFLVLVYDCNSPAAQVTLAIPSTPCPLPGASIGVPYFLQLAATGGSLTPQQWELISGLLPPGLELSPQGIISGTPTGPGTFNPGVHVEVIGVPTGQGPTGGVGGGPPSDPDVVTGTQYWISQSGGGNGSFGSPFKFSDFKAVVRPGDKGWMHSDVFQGNDSMLWLPPGLSGNPANRIHLEALADGGAIIDGEGARIPLSMNGNKYWTFRNFNLRRSSGDVAAIFADSSFNKFYRIGARDAADANTNIWSFWGSHSNYVEECFGFGTARKIVQFYYANDNITRRCGWMWNNCTMVMAGETPLDCYSLCYNSFRNKSIDDWFSWDADALAGSATAIGYGVASSNWNPNVDQRCFIEYHGPAVFVLASQNVTLDDFLAPAFEKLLTGLFSGQSLNEVLIRHAAIFVDHADVLTSRLIDYSGPHGTPHQRFERCTEVGPGGHVHSSWSVSNCESGATVGAVPSVWIPGASGAFIYVRRDLDGNETILPRWPWPMNQRFIDEMSAAGRSPLDVTATMESIWGTLP